MEPRAMRQAEHSAAHISLSPDAARSMRGVIRGLPLGARALLLLLAEAAAQTTVMGDLPFQDLPRLARLVAAPEDEVAPYLAMLRERGLVAPRPDGTLRILALRYLGGFRRLVRVVVRPSVQGPNAADLLSEAKR